MKSASEGLVQCYADDNEVAVGYINNQHSWSQTVLFS